MKHIEILKQLNEIFSANFYLVGGFVRDMLVDIHSDDYDIATDLKPEDLLEIAKQKNITAIPTGIKHGTVTLLFNEKSLEITTFRQDFENNGRHCSVKFTKSIKEDSLRRDFTINAIYLDARERLFDFYSGQDDLKKGRVRFIGSAEQRINEDYLRILRFFRFFADFDRNGISLRDAELVKALDKNSSKIENLSADRISQEFIKLAKSKNYAKGFSAMATVESLSDIFNLNYSTLNAKDVSLMAIYSEFTKLCFIYRNNLQDLLDNKNFNWSNKQKQFVKKILKFKQRNINLDDNLIKSAVVYSKEVVEFEAVCQYLDNKIIKLELLEYLDILVAKLPEFKIKGQDLIALGFSVDKNLGIVLKQVKQFWLQNNFANKQSCLDFACKIKKNEI